MPGATQRPARQQPALKVACQRVLRLIHPGPLQRLGQQRRGGDEQGAFLGGELAGLGESHQARADVALGVGHRHRRPGTLRRPGGGRGEVRVAGRQVPGGPDEHRRLARDGIRDRRAGRRSRITEQAGGLRRKAVRRDGGAVPVLPGDDDQAVRVVGGQAGPGGGRDGIHGDRRGEGGRERLRERRPFGALVQPAAFRLAAGPDRRGVHDEAGQPGRLPVRARHDPPTGLHRAERAVEPGHAVLDLVGAARGHHVLQRRDELGPVFLRDTRQERVHGDRAALRKAVQPIGARFANDLVGEHVPAEKPGADAGHAGAEGHRGPIGSLVHGGAPLRETFAPDEIRAHEAATFVREQELTQLNYTHLALPPAAVRSPSRRRPSST